MQFNRVNDRTTVVELRHGANLFRFQVGGIGQQEDYIRFQGQGQAECGQVLGGASARTEFRWSATSRLFSGVAAAS